MKIRLFIALSLRSFVNAPADSADHLGCNLCMQLNDCRHGGFLLFRSRGRVSCRYRPRGEKRQRPLFGFTELDSKLSCIHVVTIATYESIWYRQDGEV